MRPLDVSARGVSRANDVPAPPAAITRILSRFDRAQLEGFVAVAIDLMDLADGDPDREETDLEDSFALSWQARGSAHAPGDITADAADPAWLEWHTMRASQKRGPNIIDRHEDDENDDHAEEDDPSGGNTEDEGEHADEDGVYGTLVKPIYGIDQTTAPLNGATASQRQKLQERLEDAERCRDDEMARQCRKHIARVDAQEAEICARHAIDQTDVPAYWAN